MQGFRGQGCRAACAAVLAMLVFAGTAEAADPWQPVPVSCVSSSGTGGTCTSNVAARGLWKVAVAPGGAHAYGIAHESQAIILLDRNPATGQLAQRSCLGQVPADGGTGCAAGGVTALGSPNGIVVSPDGANVYVSSGASITVFDRNASTGVLTQKPGSTGCFTHDGRYPPRNAGNPLVCTPAKGIESSTLLISPDGRHVYSGPNVIGVFMRDPSTGALSQPAGPASCIAPTAADGCTPGRSVGYARQMALSPDGRSLYAPVLAGNTIAVYDRDPGTGLLAQKGGAAGCVGAIAGCTPDPTGLLEGPHALTVSPDGRNVYASSRVGMITFARAADGNIGLQSCISDGGIKGCAAGRNVGALSYSAISPDGQTVVAGPELINGIAIFLRGPDGNLAQPVGGDGCVTLDGAATVSGVAHPNQCRAHPALANNGQITFVDDSSFIAGAHAASAATAFKRDLYPQCQSQALTVTQNLAAALPLACSDRNGDPLTHAIVANPIAGALGAIDGGNARVFYNPFSGYLGADSVRFQATAAGLKSNVATLDLTVVPPTAPPPPARKPRTVSSPVTYTWSVKRTRMTIRRLQVRRLPVGATVTLTCTGKRCPLKRLTIKRSRKSTMNVLNAKAMRKNKTYRAGQTVDVRVAAPGMNTKVLRFKLRTGKVPKHRTYCVPLGAKRAQRSCG